MPKDRRAYMAVYRAAHCEGLRPYRATYMDKWRAEHPTYMTTYRAEHPEPPEKRRDYYAKRYAANPEKKLASNTNYIHRKRANGGNFPRGAWEHLKVLFGQCCAYCGRRMKRLTQDHVIPISRGGWHFSGNIVPACQSCNSRKGVR